MFKSKSQSKNKNPSQKIQKIKSKNPSSQAPKIYEGLPPDPEKENLLKTSLDHLDHYLEIGGVPYLCGERITIADIALVTELDAMEYSYKCYGEFNRWVERVKVRRRSSGGGGSNGGMNSSVSNIGSRK